MTKHWEIQRILRNWRGRCMAFGLMMAGELLMASRLMMAFVLMMTWAAVACAQDMKFRMIDATNGLSDTQIRDITQMDNGQIAVRTANLLNIYNGATVQQFPFDKDKSYQWGYDRWPREYVDSENRMWLKGYELLLLDLHTGRFDYDIDRVLAGLGIQQRLDNLFIDSAKDYWFVTHTGDLLRYDTRAKQLKTVIRHGTAMARTYGEVLEMTRYKNFCWMMFSTGYIVCLDVVSGDQLFVDSLFRGRIDRNQTRISLHCDATGNLWVAYGTELCYLNRLSRTWTTVYTLSGTDNFFTCMDIATDGTVWTGTSKSGIVEVHHTAPTAFNAMTLSQLNLDTDGTIHNDISAIYCDRDGGVWVGTLFMGMLYYHPHMYRFQRGTTTESASKITSENVRCFLPCADGSILIGSSEGLVRYLPKTHAKTVIFRCKENDVVLSLFRDSEGTVWAGTFLNSLYRIKDNSVTGTTRVTSANGPENVARAMYEDNQHRLWVSTNAGVARYDRQSMTLGSFLNTTHPELAKYRVTQTLYPGADGHSFTAVGLSGIYSYDTRNDKVSVPAWAKQLGIDHTKSICMAKDKQGRLWIGGPDGLLIYDTKNKRKLARLTTEDGLSNDNCVSITMDRDGNMWVGTANGINSLSDGELTFSIRRYSHYDGLQTGIFYENSACCTDDGTVYFGGTHGFNSINPRNHWRHGAARQPIFTGMTLLGQEVETGKEYDGNVILSENISYARQLHLLYDQNSFSISFASLDYINPTGTRYRFRLKGYESEWTETTGSPSWTATYTGLASGTYTLEVYAIDNEGQQCQSPATIEIIVEPPFWQTWWAYLIYICLLGYAGYRIYRLFRQRQAEKAKKEQDAMIRQQQEKLTQMKFRFFTNVSHEFRTPLTLIITPLEAILRRLGENRETATQRQDKDKLSSAQSLNDSPLTEQLNDSPQTEQLNVSQLTEQLTVVHDNADHLLKLVNQLLDFRRLEMGGEKLHLKNSEMVRFVHDICHGFSEMADEKHITLTFDSDIEHLYMPFDADKMYKVVNNLISNAFKFTPEGGSIKVAIHNSPAASGEAAAPTAQSTIDNVVITVQDNGMGIKPDELALIWERFYQADGVEQGASLKGSGIGLHMVKEYTEMHHGTVSAESEPGKGTTFTVTLPVNPAKPDTPDNAETQAKPESPEKPDNPEIPENPENPGQQAATTTPETPTSATDATTYDAPEQPEGPMRLLVVDDNDDFRHFMQTQLEAEGYSVLAAADGLEAEEMAKREMPDLIISDLMMPRCDGIELTHRIKTNLELSHIPLILLTAKSADEDKIDGYKAGADDYVSKPFNFELLLLRIKRLIEQRQLRQDNFRQTADFSPSEVATTSLDEDLIQRAVQAVEDNITDGDFGVEELGAAIGLSKTHLNRKLQAIVGMTPLQFIRSVRLKRAAQLLKRSQYNINEIAYRTGFNTIKYFNKHFKDAFGMTPTEYRDKE